MDIIFIIYPEFIPEYHEELIYGTSYTPTYTNLRNLQVEETEELHGRARSDSDGFDDLYITCRDKYCSECDESFTDSLSFALHDHNQTPVNYEVPDEYEETVCSASTSVSSTDMPRNDHEDTSSYCQCPICFKRYKNQRTLQKHKHIHKPERPYKCPGCPKSFVYPYQLNRHKLSHTEKLYKCEVCWKAFRRQHDMQRHNKIHE